MFSILEVGTPSHKMEKRLTSAVALSILFIVALRWAAPRFFPDLAKPVPDKPAVTSTAQGKTPAATTNTTSTTGSTPVSSTAATSTAATATPAPVPPPALVPPHPVSAIGGSSQQVSIVDMPDYTARFSNRGAELVSFKLKHYVNHDGSVVDLVKSRDPQRSDFPFALESGDPKLAPRLNNAVYAVDDRTEGAAR